MSTIATIARVVLGATFLVAAVAKIGQGRGWVQQASSMGAPRLVAKALPWIELVLGATLAAGVRPPWPAAIAIGLLTAFTVWIVAHLAAGRHPPCACFGAASTAPLSWRHAARNVALMAIGIVAALA